MKKTLALILALVLALSLVACAKPGGNGTNPPETKPSDNTEPAGTKPESTEATDPPKQDISDQKQEQPRSDRSTPVQKDTAYDFIDFSSHLSLLLPFQY